MPTAKVNLYKRILLSLLIFGPSILFLFIGWGGKVKDTRLAFCNVVLTDWGYANYDAPN